MYPNPIKSAKRKLSDNVLIASTQLAVPLLGRTNLGARMSLFRYDNQIIVWSGFPYCEDVEQTIAMLGESLPVTHLIIPNYRHLGAADSFREKFPNIKIIGPDKLKLPSGTKVDITIPTELGNKPLGKYELEKIGFDKVISTNFEIIFLTGHKNKDLVLYDKRNKFMFTADVVVTMGPASLKLEQYSKEAGYPEDYSPHWGYWGNSFFTRLLHPGMSFYKQRINLLNGTNTDEGQQGIKTLYNMEVSKLIPCHGNVVDDGKVELKKFYSFL